MADKSSKWFVPAAAGTALGVAAAPYVAPTVLSALPAVPPVIGLGAAGIAGYHLARGANAERKVVKEDQNRIAGEKAANDFYMSKLLAGSALLQGVGGTLLRWLTKGSMKVADNVTHPMLVKARKGLLDIDANLEIEGALGLRWFPGQPYGQVQIERPPFTMDFSVFEPNPDAMGIEQNQVRIEIIRAINNSPDPMAELLKFVKQFLVTNIFQQTFDGDNDTFKVFMDRVNDAKEDSYEKSVFNALVRNAFDRFQQILPIGEGHKQILAPVIYGDRRLQQAATRLRKGASASVNRFVAGGRVYPAEFYVAETFTFPECRLTFNGSWLDAAGNPIDIAAMRAQVGLSPDGGALDATAPGQLGLAEYFVPNISSTTLAEFIAQNPSIPALYGGELVAELEGFLFQLFVQEVDPTGLKLSPDSTNLTVNISQGGVAADTQSIVNAEKSNAELNIFPAAEYLPVDLARGVNKLLGQMKDAKVAESGDVSNPDTAIKVLGIESWAMRENNAAELNLATTRQKVEEMTIMLQRLRDAVTALAADVENKALAEKVRDKLEAVVSRAIALLIEEVTKPLFAGDAARAKEFKNIVTLVWQKGRPAAGKEWLFSGPVDPAAQPRIDSYWRQIRTNAPLAELFVTLTGFDVAAFDAATAAEALAQNVRELHAIDLESIAINNPLALRYAVPANRAEVLTIAANVPVEKAAWTAMNPLPAPFDPTHPEAVRRYGVIAAWRARLNTAIDLDANLAAVVPLRQRLGAVNTAGMNPAQLANHAAVVTRIDRLFTFLDGIEQLLRDATLAVDTSTPPPPAALPFGP
ncbi:MAG: hypothetical protein JNK26_04570 [Candidatus Doudnabacteria bacterium]|nr:hypothetical protein [Candidatus Doudnabacteria bacterium]